MSDQTTLRRMRLSIDAAIQNIAHGRTRAAVEGLRAVRDADAEAHPNLYTYVDFEGRETTRQKGTRRLTQEGTINE